MKHLNTYEVFEMMKFPLYSPWEEENNNKYFELSKFLQSEVLDDYDIYQDKLDDVISGTNIDVIRRLSRNLRPIHHNYGCWEFHVYSGKIHCMSIFPKNRTSVKGRY